MCEPSVGNDYANVEEIDHISFKVAHDINEGLCEDDIVVFTKQFYELFYCCIYEHVCLGNMFNIIIV